MENCRGGFFGAGVSFGVVWALFFADESEEKIEPIVSAILSDEAVSFVSP